MDIYSISCLRVLISIWKPSPLSATQTFYHCSSVWLDAQDAPSWDRNPANFTSVWYPTSDLSSSQLKQRNYFSIYSHILSRLLECSVKQKSFAFARLLQPAFLLNCLSASDNKLTYIRSSMVIHRYSLYFETKKLEILTCKRHIWFNSRDIFCLHFFCVWSIQFAVWIL